MQNILPWVEEFRPKTISEFVFQSKSNEDFFKEKIQTGYIPHLLLSGHRGTGKTSLVHVLKNELAIDNSDFLKKNGSGLGVDVIRNEILGFISTYPFGKLKIVFIDEMDYMTIPAQHELRSIMEEFTETVRFIATCNHPNRLIPELVSRFQHFQFNSLPKETMIKKIYKILKKRGVKINSPDVILECVELAYPDLRKAIQICEQSCINGELNAITDEQKNIAEYIQILDEIVKGDWVAARKLACASVNDDEWEELYKFLYTYIHETDQFSYNNISRLESALILISDYMYRNTTVADKEINFTACLIEISRLLK